MAQSNAAETGPNQTPGDERAGFPAPLIARVRSMLDEAGAPGATLALVADGGFSVSAIGFRDRERREPLKPDAMFPIYSITKTMIAAAILLLVEQNRLNLEQPVAPLFPGQPLDSRITIRHLLNHTSGLADYGGLPEYHHAVKLEPETPWTDDAFLTRVLGQAASFAPGEGWAYSNIGYLLLRQIIEQTTGESLAVALDRLMFRPFRLPRTFVAESLDDFRGITPGFSTAIGARGEIADIARRYHPGWVSHGLVVSDAADLARFMDRLFGGEILQPASLSSMLDPVAVPGAHHPFTTPAYGLGVMLDPGSVHGLVAGHAGGGPGYSAAAFHFPDLDGRTVTSVALVNTDQGDIAADLAFTLPSARIVR